jgi:hypothetical protein
MGQTVLEQLGKPGGGFLQFRGTLDDLGGRKIDDPPRQVRIECSCVNGDADPVQKQPVGEKQDGLGVAIEGRSLSDET